MRLFKIRGAIKEWDYIKNSTLLHYAVRGEALPLAKYLFQQCPALLHIKDENGSLPIHLAANRGHVDMVKFLVNPSNETLSPEQLANRLELAKDGQGRTVLHIAAYQEQLPLANDLIKQYPVLIEVMNNDGELPIFQAASSGNIELVKCLIHAKRPNLSRREVEAILINTKDKRGNTILHAAANSGKFRLVKHLVVSYPKLLAIKNNQGEAPKLNLRHSSPIALADLLIEHQAPTPSPRKQQLPKP